MLLLKENVNSYISEFLPRIGLTGSIHRMQSQNKDNFTWDNFQNNSSISLNIGLPIFNGFGSTARIMRAKADAKKAQYRAEDIKSLLIKLQARGCAVMVSDHNASQLLSVVDRAYVIANGTIVANGPPRQIVNTAEAKRLYFGEDFKI